MDGFGEGGVGGAEGGVGGRGEDVRGEEVQAEGEVGGGEDGEGFDEDVGGGLVDEEVRVELVSVGEEGRGRWWLAWGVRVGGKGVGEGWGGEMERGRVQIELICFGLASGAGGRLIQGREDCESQVIGNVWSIIMVGFLASRWGAQKDTQMVSSGFSEEIWQTHSFSSARFA